MLGFSVVPQDPDISRYAKNLLDPQKTMNMQQLLSPERMGELTCYNPLKVKVSRGFPWYGNYIYPLPSMYGIFTYLHIYH